MQRRTLIKTLVGAALAPALGHIALARPPEVELHPLHPRKVLEALAAFGGARCAGVDITTLNSNYPWDWSSDACTVIACNKLPEFIDTLGYAPECHRGIVMSHRPHKGRWPAEVQLGYIAEDDKGCGLLIGRAPLYGSDVIGKGCFSETTTRIISVWGPICSDFVPLLWDDYLKKFVMNYQSAPGLDRQNSR